MDQDKGLDPHLADASKIEVRVGVLRPRDDQEDTEDKHPKRLLSEDLKSATSTIQIIAPYPKAASGVYLKS
jgi:hypothetical protein